MLIEETEAQAHLCEIWSALLRDETVDVARDGKVFCRMIPEWEDQAQKDDVINLLSRTIGYTHRSSAQDRPHA